MQVCKVNLRKENTICSSSLELYLVVKAQVIIQIGARSNPVRQKDIPMYLRFDDIIVGTTTRLTGPISPYWAQ